MKQAPESQESGRDGADGPLLAARAGQGERKDEGEARDRAAGPARPARRPFLGAVTTACLATLAGSGLVGLARADSYPARTVQLINTFPPGGPSDILARLCGENLHKSFGQPFVVENRAGAGGNIGAQAVARARPDGHTLMVGIDSTLTINPHLYRRPGFALADFEPVIILANSGLLLGVAPQTGFRTMADLIKGGRERALNFSTAGPGSPGHITGAMLQDAYQVQVTPIGYKGNTPAVAAVASGEVDAGILATPGMLPQIQAGRILPLAVTGQRRSALLPDVPTLQEAGFGEVHFEVLYLVMAPKGTPAAIIDRLASGFGAAMKQPAIVDRLQALDLFDDLATGEAAARRLAEASQRYQAIVNKVGLKAE